jgi:hypothetical protein
MNKILGITNDVTQCECCGRNDLKSTVIIASEDGEIIGHFGSTCARSYVAGTGAEIEKRAKRITRERREMKAEIDRQVASIMALDCDMINLELRKRLNGGWETLGLNQPMKPEARREIYITWKRAQLNAIVA